MARLFAILAWASLALMAPTAAQSQTGEAAVEARITAQGYEVIYSETTWLGRLRVLAVRDDLLREVVIGPGTGEVLRDVVYEIPGLAAELAKARKGKDGRRIVDLDILRGGGEVAAGPQNPIGVGSVAAPSAPVASDGDGISSAASPASE